MVHVLGVFLLEFIYSFFLDHESDAITKKEDSSSCFN
jgi:hypothetical protein